MTDERVVSEKRIAADILIAYLQKSDSRIRLDEPDKLGDYFDIIYQRVKNG